MKKNSIKNAPWYSNAVAITIGVIIFIILWRSPEILEQLRTFIGYFTPIITGSVIAYIVNPLSNYIVRHLKWIKNERIKVILANSLAFIFMVISLVCVVMVLIPQLVESVNTFAKNFDGYMISFNSLINSLGLPQDIFGKTGIISSSEGLLSAIFDFLGENMNNILTLTAGAGRAVVQFGLAFILSIYLIAEKTKLKTGFRRLLKAIFGEQRYPGISSFLHKCDEIFNRYIVFTLIDAIIVGGANAVFMAIFGMEYIGLTSVVVAITNIIPTFGPVIGGAIGGFILLMVNPLHAIIFIIFTVALQTVDGYILKPRLFGDSLGVSGLWILIGIIVGGNIFGMLGIILAIPCVAVLDLIYGTYLIPSLEKRSIGHL